MINGPARLQFSRPSGSAEARAVTREKLITSDSERHSVADETCQLSEFGYVILENVIAGETLEKMRCAIDAINADTRLGIYEFEGHNTHRASSSVAGYAVHSSNTIWISLASAFCTSIETSGVNMTRCPSVGA